MRAVLASEIVRDRWRLGGERALRAADCKGKISDCERIRPIAETRCLSVGVERRPSVDWLWAEAAKRLHHARGQLQQVDGQANSLRTIISVREFVHFNKI